MRHVPRMGSGGAISTSCSRDVEVFSTAWHGVVNRMCTLRRASASGAWHGVIAQCGACVGACVGDGEAFDREI